MNKTGKLMLWVLLSAVIVFFTCCGLPYSCMYITAPTRWKYSFERQYPLEMDEDRKLRGVKVYHGIFGPNDYANNFYEYVAPRVVDVTVYKELDDDAVRVRLVEFSLVSSTQGLLATHDPASLPHEFVFDRANKTSIRAKWVAEHEVITDLPSGEVLTVVFTVEITRDQKTTTHIYSVISTPESRREDPFYWLPSV